MPIQPTLPMPLPSLATLTPTVFDDAEAMSRAAAAIIADEIRHHPDLLLCPAAGSTPTRTYELLTAYREHEPLLFDRLRAVQLDEWGRVPEDDPVSCEHYLRKHLLGPLGIGRERYLAFRGSAPDPEAECRRMATELAQAGPIGLCVLGLGVNGHLGFIEPADALLPHAHRARLSPETLAHPMVRDREEQPAFGLTLGMADLLLARRVLLLVSGAHKRAVLGRLLEGRISTRLPASFLHLHPRADLLCDRDALPG